MDTRNNDVNLLQDLESDERQPLTIEKPQMDTNVDPERDKPSENVIKMNDINENDETVPDAFPYIDGVESSPSSPKRGHNSVSPKPQLNRQDSIDGPDIPEVSVDKKDDVDAASVFSLFMEKDFRYYFQHPYCRIFVAYFVTFCNFLIYAEDPVAHSIKECNIPVIGNDFAFVCTRYPSNAWSLLKVVLWLSAIVIGVLIGKFLFHRLLFNRLLRIKMFQLDQGSWMVMFLCVVVVMFIFSFLYNAFLLIGGDTTLPYRISDLMGVSNSFFMKAAACGTWCGDFFTAWMVTDMMLQEKLYPTWSPGFRKWWTTGYRRVIAFWVIVLVMSFIVIFVITTDYIEWDKLNRGFLPTNEVSRAFLASFILVFDIIIVMQDWDFPHFISVLDIKLPGLDTAHIKFQVPIPDFLKKEILVHITGKWFNYGILFIVILLDLNMWKNQIFYDPFSYGQYTGPDENIFTVLDQYSLDMYNESQITYEFRNSTINPNTNLTFIMTDTKMFSKYKNYPLSIKGIAFIPGLAAFVTLGVLIIMYGRSKPTKDDPYAGRLKKRRKGWRSSARKKFLNFRNRMSKTRPAITLTSYFRRNDRKRQEPDNNEATPPQNIEQP